GFPPDLGRAPPRARSLGEADYGHGLFLFARCSRELNENIEWDATDTVVSVLAGPEGPGARQAGEGAAWGGVKDGGALLAAADQAPGGKGDLGRGQAGVGGDAVAGDGQVVEDAERVLRRLQRLEEASFAAGMVEQAGEELGRVTQAFHPDAQPVAARRVQAVEATAAASHAPVEPLQGLGGEVGDGPLSAPGPYRIGV